MVKSKVDPRFPSINSVILTQTDTTVGFVSQNAPQLYKVKSRETTKQFITTYANFKSYVASNKRVPQKYKNKVRRSKKTSFIIKNQAFRIVKYSLNSQVLRDLPWNYSTSANESGKNFDRVFCESKADIIIEDKDGLHELSSSKLYKMSNKKIKRLR